MKIHGLSATGSGVITGGNGIMDSILENFLNSFRYENVNEICGKSWIVTRTERKLFVRYELWTYDI